MRGRERKRGFNRRVSLGIGGVLRPPWGPGSPGPRYSNARNHRRWDDNVDRIADLRRRGYSIFVDNLPQNVSKRMIAQIFSRDGVILDIFIPNKARKRNQSKYGFVRFRRLEDMRMAITRNDGLTIRGKILKVKEAITDRKAEGNRMGGKNQKSRWIWRPINKGRKTQEERRTTEAQKEKTEEGKFRTIKLDVIDEKIQWLNKSVVGYNSLPREIEVIEARLMSEWPQITAVRSLGHYKTLITFEDEEVKQLALSSHKGMLLQHFEKVEAWNIYEVAESKRVWVEIRGIPPQAWAAENFSRIVEKWGRLVCTDLETHLEKNLEVAKVLIDTNYGSKIDETLYVQIGDIGTDVFLQEVKVTEIVALNNSTRKIGEQQQSVEQSSSSTLPIMVKNSLEEEVQSKPHTLEVAANQSKSGRNEEDIGEDERANLTVKEGKKKCKGQNQQLESSIEEKSNNLGSERTKVLISDERRTEDVIAAFQELPSTFLNSPCNNHNEEIEANDDPSLPPGFEKWVGPIKVQWAAVNINEIVSEDEPLSPDNENSKDSIEFELASKVGEGGGIRALDPEQASRCLAKFRKSKKEKKKKPSRRKEDISAKKKKKKATKQKHQNSVNSK